MVLAWMGSESKSHYTPNQHETDCSLAWSSVFAHSAIKSAKFSHCLLYDLFLHGIRGSYNGSRFCSETSYTFFRYLRKISSPCFMCIYHHVRMETIRSRNNCNNTKYTHLKFILANCMVNNKLIVSYHYLSF